MKRISSQFIKIIASILVIMLLSLTINASNVKSEVAISFIDDKANVNLTYIDKESLSKKEVKEIKKENPGEKISEKNNNYKLIYKKNNVVTGVISKTGITLPIGLILILIGSFTIFVSIKNKKKNKLLFLPFALLAGGLVFNQAQVNAKEVYINKTKSIEVQKGSYFEYTPDKIDGYSYTGYLLNTNNIVDDKK